MNLEIVFIPDNVLTIGKDAFNSTPLAKIYCEAPLAPEGWDNDWNSSSRPVIWSYTENSVYNDGILQYKIRSDGNAYVIGGDTSSTIINIPSTISYNENTYSVVGIGVQAFGNYKNLAIVNIPSSVTIIESYAFSNCSNFRTILIPESVTTIGTDAFAGCQRLTINCAVKEAQVGWDSAWNSTNCNVVYNYGKNQD